jgi:drug/metabolite transporter (DMT)-like permease
VICWFYAMTRIPIAEVTAMNYLNPIYVTVLAVLVLRERSRCIGRLRSSSRWRGPW